MKSTATYGMTNVSIKKEIHSGVTSYMVYADTERWGKHGIMAQFATEEEAKTWCKVNGVEIEEKTAIQLFEEEMNKPFGKIQIGCAMFRRLRKENGRYIGFGGWGSGFKYDEDLTDALMNCKMTGDKVGKTKFRGGNKTVKFGTKCTW